MPSRRSVAVVVLAALLVTFPRSALGVEAELPRAFLDTTLVPPTGRLLPVRSGGDFQAALVEARPGDVIELEAGATFTGPFELPKKEEAGWIIVRTSAHASLPRPGTRVDPSDSAVMPKLVAPAEFVSALTTAPGAHHFRFIGIEFKPAPGTFVQNLIALGVRQPDEELPHTLVFDRCYIHGDPLVGARRGIVLNSTSTAVIDSYLADFKEVEAESQTMLGWNGPGPFKIVNNYLEAAGENIMVGGADPARLPDCDPAVPDTYINCLVPSDIEIRHNHFAKPLAWRTKDPPWLVKNLLELKNARRVLIDGNLFERNWLHGQAGTAIVLTVRNQGGTAPWSTVEDVTFINNIVRHTGSGILVHGWDDLFPSQLTKRILIRNNLWEDVSGARWGGAGRLFEANKAIEDLVIDHNTGFQDGPLLSTAPDPLLADRTHTGFAYRNNLTLHGAGVIGVGTGVGLSTLTTYFPGHVFAGNVLVGGHEALYPPGNFFPAFLTEVGFVDLAGGDYRLVASSPFKHGGTDGKDIGLDVDALRAATAGVIGGVTNEVCAVAQASRPLLWPPNHELTRVAIVGVTDPNHDGLTIAITGVTQDEPVIGLGDGDASPDAVIQAETVLLRAERSGMGDGRVYRVHFTVHDGLGETCTGSVTVGVPQNPKRGLPVDNGQHYDSTRPS